MTRRETGMPRLRAFGAGVIAGGVLTGFLPPTSDLRHALPHLGSLSTGVILSVDAILLLGAALGVGLIAYAWIRRVRAEARARRLTLALEESRRTGEKLRRGEARLRGMVEGLSVGVTVHGADGGVVYANAAALG